MNAAATCKKISPGNLGAVNQPEFPSLAFPADRKQALRVEEIARLLDCTSQHVHDLMEEGALQWVDISGLNNSSDRKTRRVPVESWNKFIRDNTN